MHRAHANGQSTYLAPPKARAYDQPMDELLVAHTPNGVATLTLNRPERKNALSVSLREAISDALDREADDQNTKAVVLTGSGNVFSAGFDLKEFEKAGSDSDFASKLWASSDRFHRRMLTFPLPIVAACNGPAVAGGFDLAVMCDVRVAATTTFFAHPELSFGDVVYGPLHDLVGGSIAREICLTGRSMPADEALRVGLVTHVVDAADVRSKAEEIASSIARAPRTVLLRTKAKFIRRALVVTNIGPEGEATLDL